MEISKGFKQTEVGRIPDDWQCIELENAIEDITYGLTVRPKYHNSGIPLISAKECLNSKIDFDNAKKISEFDFRGLRLRALPKVDDILFSKTGTIGRVSRVRIKDPTFAITQNVALIRPKNKIIESEFLEYYLKSNSIKNEVNNGINALGVPDLQLGAIRKFHLALPPKKEQGAIANALSDVDAYIESLEKLIAKKRLIKKGIMQELLTGKRRLQGFKDNWKMHSLGDFGTTYGGLTGKVKSDFGDGNARYVTFLNVINNVLIDHSLHESVNVPENENQNTVKDNDLLFNGSSETPEEVAFCSCVTGNVKNLFLNSFCFGFRATKEGLSSQFMAYFFRGPAGRELVKSLAQGATRYNISKSALLKAPFKLPSLEEQNAIAEILLDIDKDIASKTLQLQKAHLIKQGMMQELLTGRIRLV